VGLAGQVDVELPSGERFWHHIVRLHRAAMMALVDDEDRVRLLIKDSSGPQP
jgi:hypothetical protein